VSGKLHTAAPYPHEEPLISTERGVGWAPKTFWTFEKINCLPLPSTKQFLRLLVIINCASLAIEIMVGLQFMKYSPGTLNQRKYKIP
jgi:hypothetical protein